MSGVILDLEADGLLDTASVVHCAVGVDADTGEMTKFSPANISELPAYLDGFETWIGHNIICYDAPLLKKVIGYEYKGELFDTLVLSRLLNPRMRGHGLGEWGERFGIAKPAHEDWTQFSEDMLHRCTEDTRINAMLYKHLGEQSHEGWDKAVKSSMAFFKLMGMQERHGWLVDTDHMNRSVTLLTHWMNRIERIVVPTLPGVKVVAKPLSWHEEPFKRDGNYKAVTEKWLAANGFDPAERPLLGPISLVHYRDMDLGKRDEVVAYLLSSGWRPRAWNSDKEGKRTSPKLNADDPLEGLNNRPALLISKYIQCRHRRSQIEGWFKRVDTDGRLRQSITGIATTGRLKHSGIVNVPGARSFFGKAMRKCFIAPQGYVIVGTDAAGCQNRMLAARVGSPEFTETLVNGDKSKGTSIHQVNQKAIKDVAGIEVGYGQAKALNYAFLFGASNNKLGTMVNRSADAGEIIRKALLGVAPGFKDLLSSLTTEWRSEAKHDKNKWGKPSYSMGKIRGLDGRPILVESEHQILNYALQSDEAIMMQVALLFLYKACTQRGWVFGEDYAFLANVHDEFQSEVREEIAEEFAEVSAESIKRSGEYFQIGCPQEGDSAIGKTWADTH